MHPRKQKIDLNQNDGAMVHNLLCFEGGVFGCWRWVPAKPHRSILTLALALFMLTGCGGEQRNMSMSDELRPEPLTAATLGEQTVLSVSEYRMQSPYAEADHDKGATQAQFCRACHSLERGGANMIGPNLHGFFGRQAGTVAGFDYSDVLLDADFVWTPRALDAWLVETSGFLPGNRMFFAGVNDAGKRADLIAYLMDATESD